MVVKVVMEEVLPVWDHRAPVVAVVVMVIGQA